MDDTITVDNSMILTALGITGFDEMSEFFSCYLDVKNEIQALALSTLPYSLLMEWKTDENYIKFKGIIDEYFLSLIELEIMNLGLQGSYKHAELLLINKNPEFAKDKKKDNGEVDTIDSLISNMVGSARAAVKANGETDDGK